MRLFVAVWPTEAVRTELASSGFPASRPSMRWVPADNWHVTLAFLGSVPDVELEELVTRLRSIEPSTTPCTARLGPETRRLGRAVLCVPVDGLDDLAAAVRQVTRPFTRAQGGDEPFLGHLTLARARRGGVPAGLGGHPVTASWAVNEIRLVASTTRPVGPQYDAVAVIGLGG